MKTVTTINEVLFNIDPMNLGTVENNSVDEYLPRAEGIIFFLEKGLDLLTAIKNEFEYAFWADCLSEEVISEIVNSIEN